MIFNDVEQSGISGMRRSSDAEQSERSGVRKFSDVEQSGRSGMRRFSDVEQSGRSGMETSGKSYSEENNKPGDKNSPESCFLCCLIKYCCKV
jgi:hypothetical protein